MSATGGVLLSDESSRVLQQTVDDVRSIKQQVQQVTRKTPVTVPMEIFVPRSVADGIYTGDLYIRDPSTGNYIKLLSNQTAELLPDSFPP